MLRKGREVIAPQLGQSVTAERAGVPKEGCGRMKKAWCLRRGLSYSAEPARRSVKLKLVAVKEGAVEAAARAQEILLNITGL